jgi:hypothetical protein
LIDVVRQFEKSQRSDPEYWIIKLIETHSGDITTDARPSNEIKRVLLAEYTNLKLREELLYYEALDRDPIHNKLQLVLSADGLKELVVHMHSSFFNAYSGCDKTIHRITDRLYRPSIAQHA